MTADKTESCPLCGDAMTGPHDLETTLALHYHRMHSWFCWCGYGAGSFPGAIVGHFEDNGGFYAHLLECKLGVKDAAKETT